MMNLTIISLSICSHLSMSPIHTMQNLHKSQVSMAILNSHYSRSFTNFIYSNAIRHNTVIKNDIFSNTLSSAIMFTSEQEEQTQKNTIIKNKEIKARNHYNNINQYGNLTIASCQFIKCITEDSYGGALFIEQECTVMLHESIFDGCHAKDGSGGYICKSRNTDRTHGSITDELLLQVDTQYCCFQNCYTKNNDADQTGFGSALMLAGVKVILFYASTVDCVLLDNEENKIQSRGAQFDIQSHDVSSQYVNATGGYAKYCGSIEYRYSKRGFFMFQTITNMECMFVISFSKFDIESINITYCNLIKNTLLLYDETAMTYPAMMKITETDLNIENFVFIDNFFGNDGRIASRDLQASPGDHRYDNQKITLYNCLCNNYETDENRQEAFTTVDCNLKVTDKELTPNPIEQLNLGKCQGVISAPELVITKAFTPSDYFSKSSVFSQTKQFSSSFKFTKTDQFTRSNVFTITDAFSESNLPNLPPNNGDSSDSGKKLKPSEIAGIAVGVAAAVAIIALVAFFLIRRNRMKLPDDEDIETLDGSSASTRNDNPIYNKEAEDDPFKEDF